MAVNGVPDVVRRMEQIQDQLPPTDGVRWFDHLYLEVTRAVAAGLDASSFRDPAFMQRLDVVFANRYFAAFDAAEAGSADLPAAWAPLFESRHETAIAPLQFALCGMNAHINFDLALALVATYTELGGEGAAAGPREGTDRHQDYCSVNDILASVETRVRSEYETELTGVIDHAFPTAGDKVAHWSIVDARAAAWASAQVLWSLRDDRLARSIYIDSLGHLVGFAGRGLLIAA